MIISIIVILTASVSFLSGAALGSLPRRPKMPELAEPLPTIVAVSLVPASVRRKHPRVWTN